MWQRVLALVGMLLVAFSAPVLAADAKVVAPAGHYVEDLGNTALAAITNPKFSKAKKQEVLEKLFHENVDFDWVAKFVMGRFWRQATDDQKKNYVAAYRDFLTRHYTERFTEYTSGSFKVLDAREFVEGESLVNMEIVSHEKNAQPILIDYKVRKTPGGFKVFDIIVEGVSLLTTQRSEFTAVLNKSGIDGLIAQLRAK